MVSVFCILWFILKLFIVLWLFLKRFFLSSEVTLNWLIDAFLFWFWKALFEIFKVQLSDFVLKLLRHLVVNFRINFWLGGVDFILHIATLLTKNLKNFTSVWRFLFFFFFLWVRANHSFDYEFVVRKITRNLRDLEYLATTQWLAGHLKSLFKLSVYGLKNKFWEQK